MNAGALAVADRVSEAKDRRIAELEAALRPFASLSWMVGPDGWVSSESRAPISTWMGPSDFRAAGAALPDAAKSEG